MQPGDPLDPLLNRLGNRPAMPVSDDFMDGVWERAGRLQARREARGRLMLLACLAIVGLGAGATVAQAPAYAEPRTYVVSSEARLSPAALLQVEP